LVWANDILYLSVFLPSKKALMSAKSSLVVKPLNA
jgi:hypothetical protein